MSGGVAGGKLHMSTVATPAFNGVKKSTSTNTNATVEPPPSPAISARGKPASVHSTDGEKHKFTLKDLLANGPKLARRSSQRSTGSRSSRKSDGGESDGGYRSGGGPKSTGGDSSSSLKKYGVCQKVAIGKGATSVVRLAHKWDRSEERLYAIKVRSFRLRAISFTDTSPRNFGNVVKTRPKRSMLRSLRLNSVSPPLCITPISSKPLI